MQLHPEMNKMGVMNVFKHTVNTHGMMGLYRGYSALLMFSVPKNYVRFSGFTFARSNLFTGSSRMDTFCCGLVAGALESTFVVTP